MPQFEVRLESWRQIWPEAEPLMRAHHLEVNSPGPFKVATAIAEAMDDNGGLMVLAARAKGVLAQPLLGYLIWYLSPQLNSADLLTACQGAFFVRSSWRPKGVGLALWRRSLAALRAHGVNVAYPHDWHQSGGSDLSRLFERAGARRGEQVWILEL